MSEIESDKPVEADGVLHDKPYYGVLQNYLDTEKGRYYFVRQDSGGSRAAKYNHPFFEPYMNDSDTVLDFGCGSGYLLSLVPGRAKVGIDINPAARASAAAKGIEVYSALSELSGRKFSRIITSHALEHVPNPYIALCTMKDFLHQKGLFLWLSPMDDWHNHHQREWRPNDFDMHLYAWTPLTIGNLLTAAGYHVLSVETVTHAIPPKIGDSIWRVSPQLFHYAARLWATITNRRQLLAIAELPTEK
jgi:hypothetical protein